MHDWLDRHRGFTDETHMARMRRAQEIRVFRGFGRRQSAKTQIHRRALSCDEPCLRTLWRLSAHFIVSSLRIELVGHGQQDQPRSFVSLAVGEMAAMLGLVPKLLWSVIHNSKTNLD